MTFNLQEWLTKHSKDDILFLFQGEVSSTLIADSLVVIESKLEEASPKSKKKIYNVLVEALQNLYHHSSILPEVQNINEKGKYAICILSKNNIGYHVITGNFVNNKQKDFLTKHLSHINELDKEELKGLYKEILDNQEFSDKGGGGLGMVDIARKSGSKLDFNFYNYAENYYFFSLNVNIVE
jgi:hypothetical protein